MEKYVRKRKKKIKNELNKNEIIPTRLKEALDKLDRSSLCSLYVMTIKQNKIKKSENNSLIYMKTLIKKNNWKPCETNEKLSTIVVGEDRTTKIINESKVSTERVKMDINKNDEKNESQIFQSLCDDCAVNDENKADVDEDKAFKASFKKRSSSLSLSTITIGIISIVACIVIVIIVLITVVCWKSIVFAKRKWKKLAQKKRNNDETSSNMTTTTVVLME